MHLQLNNLRNNLTTLLRRNNLFSNRITQLRRNSLRNSRIMPLRQNNRWQVTPGKPKSSNPLLLHSLHTRLSKLISSQPLRSRCTQPQPVEQQPVVEPEPVVEETKPARPPLYYFEEVEEKRAREREQPAAGYY
ncbi:hypothetical protein ACLB1E_27500 [Escherichia coli]